MSESLKRPLLVPDSLEFPRRKNKVRIGLNLLLLVGFLSRRILIQLIDVNLELHRVKLVNVDLLAS